MARETLGGRSRHRTEGGFTLIEMIISMLLLSVLMVVVTMILRLPIEAYYDVLRRTLLSDAANAAVRRVSQEVRGALPNSMRQTDFGTSSCVEFLPVVGAGGYRTAQTASGTGDILAFNTTDASFDVLSSNNLPDFAAATYHAVIYNLGIPDADAYNTTDRNHAQISATGSSASNIRLAVATKFIFDSPSHRFMVIPNYSVIFSCNGGKLYRTTRAITTAALTACPASGQLLADKVGSCKFYYTSGVSASAGLLSMRLGISDMGETVTMYQDINVDNTP